MPLLTLCGVFFSTRITEGTLVNVVYKYFLLSNINMEKIIH